MLINRKSIYYTRLFLDLLIVNISFLTAAVISQSWEILLARNYMFILMIALNFLWYFVSNVINFYEDFNSRSFAYQFINLIKSVFVQVLSSILFIFFMKEDLFTRNFIVIHSGLLIIFVSLRIELMRFIIRRIRGSEKNIRNMLIIGAGEIGKNFESMINEHNEFGYQIKGFLDNEILDRQVIGKTNELDNILNDDSIEVVVVALPIYASGELDEIIKTCNKHAVRVHIIPDYFKFVSKKFQVNMIGDFPIITVRSEPLSEAHWRFIKRIFDIIFSILFFIFIFSWLLPVIALIIKFSSKGPVFFKQERVGANNRIFKCYKFRTMRADNPTADKYQPTISGDPRITGIGKFLRRSNLDEIPQFINVIKGEMSVVGPRPHPIAFNQVYTEMVEEIKIRGWVKPGITGWAQVHGLRGDVTDYEENRIRTKKRIDYDLWYIENWSFFLDLQIIMLTVWQMVKGDTKGL